MKRALVGAGIVVIVYTDPQNVLWISSLPMDGCDQCTDLWRAYARATTEHIRLLREQEAAAAKGRVSQFRELELKSQIAGDMRERARMAIKLHLAKDHNEEPRSMVSA